MEGNGPRSAISITLFDQHEHQSMVGCTVPREPQGYQPGNNKKEFRKQEYHKFLLRDPIKPGNLAAQIRINEKLEQTVKCTRFHIRDAMAADTSGLPDPMDRGQAALGTARKMSYIADNQGWVWVGLSFSLIEPLMRTDLTSAERAVDTFRLASTLLHETAHATWLNSDQNKDGCVPEPFFEDECISELGFSAETAMFGGCPMDIVQGPFGQHSNVPAGGMYQQSFNNYLWDDYTPQLPTLTTAPPSWNYKDYAPIPVGYFVQLHNPEFWDVYARKLGREAAWMAPKPLITRRINNATSNKRDEFKHLDDITVAWSNIPEIPIDRTRMSTSEIKIIELENQRINRNRRIANSLRALKEQRQAIKATHAQGDLANYIPISPDLDPEPKISLTDCPQFTQIQQYLFANRRELALDSMNFPMPECTLYSYILANGGITLTPDTWRAFLKICNHTPYLFKLEVTRTLRVIKTVDFGWPTTKLPPRREPAGGGVSKEIQTAWLLSAKQVIARCDVFQHGFRDHDLDDFRVSSI